MGITNIEATKNLLTDEITLMISYNNGQKVTKIKMNNQEFQVLKREVNKI